jgi:soluble lytic murein transglycosylase-like protein
MLFVLAGPRSSANEPNCWAGAGYRYDINPWLLYAIAEQESSLNPLALNARSENDEDIGLMQINTFWLPHLSTVGIKRSDLFDGCTSIYVGAWVLAQSISSFGNTWEAVGAYNVGTSKEPWAYIARGQYASDIYRRYVRFIEQLRVNVNDVAEPQGFRTTGHPEE